MARPIQLHSRSTEANTTLVGTNMYYEEELLTPTPEMMLENYIETRFDFFGEVVYTQYWSVIGILGMLEKEEVEPFVEDIKTWVINGSKLENINLTKNDEGDYLSLEFNLVSIEKLN